MQVVFLGKILMRTIYVSRSEQTEEEKKIRRGNNERANAMNLCQNKRNHMQNSVNGLDFKLIIIIIITMIKYCIF